VERFKFLDENLREALKRTQKIIRRGGVIVCPTDTVYGLIADAKSEKAVTKVFQIKKRTFNKPIPIFVKDLRMAKGLAIINKFQEKFLKKVWPGKVTVVLRAKSKNFPKGIVGKDGKIGLRIPNYKIINQLLLMINSPLTGTSANISEKPESTKIKEVLKQFQNQKYQPDLILDAGNLKPSKPSTAVDLTNFKILREGAISKKEILDKIKLCK